MARREALWQAMQDANVTGREMAKALGVSESRFSQLLNGSPMREDQIAILADRLGICADVIIFDRPPAGADPYESEYIQLYRRKLNHAQRVRLVQFLRELPDVQVG